MRYPWNLKYWQSGEWQVVNERLKDMEKAHVRYNPIRRDLFKSLSTLAPSGVRVVIIGQDPYPDCRLATGYAFSIPKEISRDVYPPSLRTILDEYCSDLHREMPSSGDLTPWQTEGVLLWNCIPSCKAGISLSHDWPGKEWEPLTSEIIRMVSQKGVVFVFVGSVARRFREYVTGTNNRTLVVSHPSPLGQMNTKTPFRGSRIFSTINDNLTEIGLDPIDWSLDVPAERGSRKSRIPRSGVVLNNITGADLPGKQRP